VELGADAVSEEGIDGAVESGAAGVVIANALEVTEVLVALSYAAMV